MSDMLPDNYALTKRLQELERRLAALEQRPTTAGALDEFGTDDLGDMRAGRFLALSSGVNPSDPDAVGVFMSAAGETIGNMNANIGGVYNGNLEFYMDAITGKAGFANGSGSIDQDGIKTEGLSYGLDMHATSPANGEERYGHVEMIVEGPNQTPSASFTDESSTTGANLVVNGDFETGSLSNWTEVVTSGKWSAQSVTVNSGAYAARALIDSAVISGKSYLDSDLITVTGGNCYRLNLFLKMVSGAGNATAFLMWKNDGTFVAGAQISSMRNWSGYEISGLAPAGATNVKVRIIINHIAGTVSEYYFDDITLFQLNQFKRIHFFPRLTYQDELSARAILSSKRSLFSPPIYPNLALSASATGLSVGNYSYCYTFYDTYGETPGGPTGDITTTSANRNVVVSNIKPGPPGTVGRKIYRTWVGAGGNTFSLLTTIANNSGIASYTDSTPDASLGALKAYPAVNTTLSRKLYPSGATILGRLFIWDDGISNSIVALSSAYTGYATGADNPNRYRCMIADVLLGPGTYNVAFFGIKTPGSGIINIYVDDQLLVSGVDMYSASNVYNFFNCTSNFVTTEPGIFHVQIAVMGANGSATAFGVYISQLAFRISSLN